MLRKTSKTLWDNEWICDLKDYVEEFLSNDKTASKTAPVIPGNNDVLHFILLSQRRAYEQCWEMAQSFGKS